MVGFWSLRSQVSHKQNLSQVGLIAVASAVGPIYVDFAAIIMFNIWYKSSASRPLDLTLYLLVSSAVNFCKQIGSRLGLTFVGPDWIQSVSNSDDIL